MKTRTKTLKEGEAVNSLKEQTKLGKVSVNKGRNNSANKRRENDDWDVEDSSQKEVFRCKFFSAKHRAASKSRPPPGKSCSVCGRMNHFASQSFTKTRVNVVESESEGELVEYCLTFRSVNESEVIRVDVASDLEYARTLFATIKSQLTSEIHQSSFNWIVGRRAI